MDKKDVKKIVRDAYGKIAQEQQGCGSCGKDPKEFAKSMGYSEEELKNIPEEANLALSCGNPTEPWLALKKEKQCLIWGAELVLTLFWLLQKSALRVR